MIDCPNGHRTVYVVEDAGAGTGYYCPTCGASLSGRPDPWSVYPLVILALAAALAGTFFWCVFLR